MKDIPPTYSSATPQSTSPLAGWPNKHLSVALEREAAARRAEHAALVAGDHEAQRIAANERAAAWEDRLAIQGECAGFLVDLLRLAIKIYPRQIALLVLQLPGVQDAVEQHLDALNRIDDLEAIIAQEVAR